MERNDPVALTVRFKFFHYIQSQIFTNICLTIIMRYVFCNLLVYQQIETEQALDHLSTEDKQAYEDNGKVDWFAWLGTKVRE